jgi:hypothetical protein
VKGEPPNKRNVEVEEVFFLEEKAKAEILKEVTPSRTPPPSLAWIITNLELYPFTHVGHVVNTHWDHGRQT